MKKQDSFQAVGRRKEAVARVIIRPGKGHRMVNGLRFSDYFQGATTEMIINQPFAVLENGSEWDVIANVNGGGKSGQADAVKLGIARALISFNENNRGALRSAGLVTRDSRIVQRKHYGRAKARKRFQFSKR